MTVDEMHPDKQLCGVNLDDVLQKRQLDQALNVKEFAVLAGISYSTARGWFRLPGFPVIEGVVFWGDFVQWRRCRTRLGQPEKDGLQRAKPAQRASSLKTEMKFPARAARILSEAG